jgi:hypothetical protein
LNDELDSLTIFVQQNAEAGDRAIRAPVTDPTTIDMTLPTKTDRAGKYLSFNSSTGNPEVVNTVVDVTTVAANIANINTVAGISGNVTTVAGVAANVTTVAGIAANVTTVAGISGNVTTVAGISADVTTVAADGTDIGTVAGLSTEIAALGPIAADITTVAGIDSDVTAVAADATDIGTVASNIANVNTVAGISADVTAVAGDATDIGAVAAIAANVTTVAGVAANVTTVAGIAANVTTVAGISSDVTTVAANVADITNFSDVYLGPAATDPATRNDSSALQEGDLYFNTVDDAIKVYTGSAWVTAYITADGFVTVADAQTITGVKTFDNGLNTDTISEETSAAGVTVDGVLLKDSQVTTDQINEKTSAAGVTIDGVLLKDSEVTTDVIKEKTSAAGVTIDSVLLKDNKVTANELTINSNNISADNSLGFRNRIVNGDMRIDQRNAGASVTLTADLYTVDRFLARTQSATDSTAQRSTTAPSGFNNSLLVTIGTGASPASSASNAIRQEIEGFNVADLGWGTAGAETITISFWVRSSLTGTFGGALSNAGLNRAYPYTYSISSADTWEYKTITIPGDTSGTWATDNSSGIRFWVDLGSGTDKQGTAGSWAAADYRAASGCVQLVATSGATFYITGVQLEVGSVATPFERRPYGTELALCQRYYYRVTLTATAQDFGNGFNVDTVTARVLVPFPTTMRTNPSAVEQTGTASDYRVRTGTVTACSQVPSFQSATSNTSSLFFVVASGLTAGQGCMGGTSVTTGAYLGWSAEL